MVRLGTRVKVQGRDGVVIGRVVSGNPTYDVRLPDGSMLKNVPERDVQPLAA